MTESIKPILESYGRVQSERIKKLETLNKRLLEMLKTVHRNGAGRYYDAIAELINIAEEK